MLDKKELETKVAEIRSLKTLKEETENAIKALENEVISYMREHELAEEFTETSKITYQTQERRSLDKEKVKEAVGGDLSAFEKVTTYGVLRIK